MKNIKVRDQSIQDLLSGSFYGIDYYQREYKWGRKHLQELVEDLTGRFMENYQPGDSPKKVAGYGSYFLGSIVVSRQNETSLLVDGQQRISSILILLIYLNNLQKKRDDNVNIEQLIFADDLGEKKFRLNVPEHNECLTALFEGKAFNPDECSVSIQNLVDRYYDFDELLSDDLRGDAFKLFIYWFTTKVNIIEILAHTDEDAYNIFETMNDRGLSLTPTDMLRGYILANITNDRKRCKADQIFKDRLSKFAEYGEGTDSDFIKTWLRSQYAEKIRDNKKSSKPEDFDLIGTEYHRWVRKNASKIDLNGDGDFYDFIGREFRFFSEIYLRLIKAAEKRTEGLESIRYNSDAGFTLQYHLILSGISLEDNMEIALDKAGLIADYLDIWLNLRLWNGKSNNYSTVKSTIFSQIRAIRGKPIDEIRGKLQRRLNRELKKINFNAAVYLKRHNSKIIHRQLARFIDWLEQESGEPGNYENYVVRSGKYAFEIEHIWANHYDQFSDEFDQQADFERFRNKIGGLLLLPKKVNASLSDMSYSEKLKHYYSNNALAKSLHKRAYEKNPGFLRAIKKFDLPFKSHGEFTMKDMEERSELYCRLAEVIWSPDRLLGGDTS